MEEKGFREEEVMGFTKYTIMRKLQKNGQKQIEKIDQNTNKRIQKIGVLKYIKSSQNIT